MISENESYTTSVRQTSHQDSVHKFGLRHICLSRSCLRFILLHKKICSVAHFFYKKSPSVSCWDAFIPSFVILSTNALLVKMI